MAIDAGVIDSDFKGIVKALLINHNINKPIIVRTGDRIAQVVFMERFDVIFEKVSHPDLIGKTKRLNDGLGSTGVQVIKKAKKECPFNFLISKVLDDDHMTEKKKIKLMQSMVNSQLLDRILTKC